MRHINFKVLQQLECTDPDNSVRNRGLALITFSLVINTFQRGSYARSNSCSRGSVQVFLLFATLDFPGAGDLDPPMY